MTLEELEEGVMSSHHLPHRKSEDEEEFLSRRLLLSAGERIVFIVDVDCEELLSEWDGSGKLRVEALFDAFRVIMKRKINATLTHYFAIATYDSTSSVKWQKDFSSSFDELDEILSSIHASMVSQKTQLCDDADENGSEFEGVNMSRIFDQIGAAISKYDAIKSTESGDMSLITRYIFTYSRSKQSPVYDSTSPLFTFPDSRTHFLDVLFLHKKLTQHRECLSHCQRTLNILSIAQRGDEEYCEDEHSEEENNYMFETHPSNMKLMTYAALLCCHPAHREEQNEMLEKFNVSDESLSKIREVDEQDRINEAKRKASTIDKKQQATSQKTKATPKSVGESAADTVKNMFSGRQFGGKS